jgi:AraC family transcriptional regulator
MAYFDNLNLIIEKELRHEDALTFLGTRHYTTPEFASTCEHYYVICAPVTPRPAGIWGTYDELGEPVPIGDLIFHPAGLLQYGSFHPHQGVRQDVYCLLDRQKFDDLGGGNIDWSKKRLREALNISDHRLHSSMKRLVEEIVTPGMATSLARDSLANLIVIDLQRHFGKFQDVRREPRTMTAAQVQNIEAFLRANLGAPLRVADLASLCGMSIRTFTRSFKRTTGLTLTQHASNIRLSVSQDLLKLNIPIKVIANKVGFSDASSFTSAFRRACGMTPDAFRRRCAG